MKNADLKIWSVLTQNRGLTLWLKVDFWGKNKYSFKKLPMESVDPKKSPETRFRSSKGQGTRDKEIAQNRWNQDKSKNENVFNFLPGRY